MRRVIIAGSRTFDDMAMLCCCMHRLFYNNLGNGSHWQDITVLCGMAQGADLLGKEWAENATGNDSLAAVEEYPAEWEKYGERAGPIRNAEMACKADTLVAFWDGKSPGTKDMIHKALAVGLEVHVYRF